MLGTLLALGVGIGRRCARRSEIRRGGPDACAAVSRSPGVSLETTSWAGSAQATDTSAGAVALVMEADDVTMGAQPESEQCKRATCPCKRAGLQEGVSFFFVWGLEKNNRNKSATANTTYRVQKRA